MKSADIISIVALVIALAVVGCSDKPEDAAIGMPNPASVHCQELGGISFVESDVDGEVGYCKLPTGDVVEEWKLYRSDPRN